MAKIKLGARPSTFKKTVSLAMLDGTTGTIECKFKYRTKKEFGAFLDGLFKAAEGENTEPEGAKLSLADLMTKTVDKNAQYLLDVLDGWNLDTELSLEALEQLCDELPGAAAAIMDTYRIAVTEGRLGN